MLLILEFIIYIIRRFYLCKCYRLFTNVTTGTRTFFVFIHSPLISCAKLIIRSDLSESRYWPHTITSAGNLFVVRFPTFAVPSPSYKEQGFTSLHAMEAGLYAFLEKKYISIYYGRRNKGFRIENFLKRYVIFFIQRTIREV